ncbi:MAG: hypothetical protein GEU82_06425 [Luteitalea sp.]|nr:hypothetical protein [Luteitalea sp.]
MKRSNCHICWLAYLVSTGLALTLIAPPVAAQRRGAAAPAEPRDPCATPANRIIAENCKPGNDSTEWDINGYGDPTIQGFPTEMSVLPNETINFKIETPATRYRVDVFRMGYYGGKGARKIATLQPVTALPQVQPECVHDYATRLYDCGNWAVSATWRVPADAVSGVYVARAVREDAGGTWRVDNGLDPAPKPPVTPHAYGANGLGKLRNALKEPRASHMVFVVRDDTGRSAVIFQTADESWQAYNRYGLGNSYSGLTPAGEATGQANRAYKVSYNRPITNRETGSVNQLFNAEYPMIRWLERNGYDVSYFTGVDADRRGEELKEHKLFLSVGHDEYWSGNQRKNVEAARDEAGVNMAFLSGNEVFWKTRFENSVDGTNTPYRTMAIYKETHTRITPTGELQPGRKIDPLPDVWTGTWRDSSPFNPEGPQPENALTGTIFTVNAYRNDPLVVTGRYAGNRFWRNTEVARLKPDQSLALAKGILGHEWDEDLDNGFRPTGIIHLSETTVDGVQYIQDFGSVYDSGTATHHLTLYRAKSGALVFGAGTVQYTWGLDNFHDNATGVPADRANRYSIRVGIDQTGPSRAMQQATVNLFADMAVQPANLQNDLAPATASVDKSAPVSKIAFPLGGQTVAGRVTITGTATDTGGGTVGAVDISTDGGATWHPAKGLDRWSYDWDVPRGVGAATILSRSVDDSLNLEVPGKGTTVSNGASVTP